MAAFRIKLNHRTVQSYLDGEHGVRAMMYGVAAPVLAAAQAGAPTESGDYLAGLHVEEAHTDRLAVRVAGSTDHDWIVEARTGNLARALDAAG